MKRQKKLVWSPMRSQKCDEQMAIDWRIDYARFLDAPKGDVAAIVPLAESGRAEMESVFSLNYFLISLGCHGTYGYLFASWPRRFPSHIPSPFYIAHPTVIIFMSPTFFALVRALAQGPIQAGGVCGSVIEAWCVGL